MDQAHPHRRDGVAHFEERLGHLGETSVPEDQAETPLFILSNWRLEGNRRRAGSMSNIAAIGATRTAKG
jgi:hypothetical protein